MYLNRGSEWNRWDLHVHTPYSYLNHKFGDNFDEYVKDLFKSAIENKISVIGITDYFCIEGYKKIKNEYLTTDSKLKKLFNEDEIEKIKHIQLLPNIEFRLNKIIGNNRVNFHILFSENVSIKDIEENFLHNLEFVYESTPQATDEKWKLKLSNIEDFGKKLIREQPTLGNNNMFVGMKCAAVDDAQILEILNNQSKFKDKFLVVIPPDEDLSKINWNSQDHNIRKIIIQKTDLLFTSNTNTIKWGLGELDLPKGNFIKEFKSIKVSIWGSDAHDRNKLFKPDNGKYCWIKADPTFEGLKQVVYEPSRVYIGETKPQEALHKLDNIELTFDENTKWENDKFCFADFKETLHFSPYLTCIIGGRGSGKSTLLNLIAKKIDKEKSNFFNKLDIKDISSKIIFNPNEIDNIEFLAQNEIEEFARDSKKFTEAIFKRLDKNAGRNLSQIEDNIAESLKKFDEQIEFLIKGVTLNNELKKQEKVLEKFENIVKTLTDKGYLSKKEELQEVNKKILILEKSRDRFENLYEKLKNMKEEYNEISEIENDYDKYFNELYQNIDEIVKNFQKKDYSKIKQEKDELKISKEEYLKRIEEYLKSQGMNEENIKDAQNASSNIESIKDFTSKRKAEIEVLKKNIISFSYDSIDKDIESFKTEIEEKLKKINDKFYEIASANSEDVKVIKVEYKLDENIFEKVLEQFLGILKSLEYEIKIDKGALSGYLQKIPLTEVLEYKYKDFIDALEAENRGINTQTHKRMIDIFSQQLSFNIYKLLIKKNFRDVKRNKLLKVFYDNKTLENTSFGQRCTAAIVILISLGNNPIIIDEPEAHLDSSLIANYLVDLIKDKKQHRQIIFATHNANFVLNADAELIIKLENNSGVTKSKSFAIENILYRSDLLKLEGGIEAFKKREKKYGI